uniref:Uncharacterized protein n=1 Tax=Ralstonia solanacearum CFBP2957 TaxID=859656 RepID=D8P6Y8_RALSL|nr:protein of unknown function [Ralstonia solanacearum CFBP2957]
MQASSGGRMGRGSLSEPGDRAAGVFPSAASRPKLLSGAMRRARTARDAAKSSSAVRFPASD